MARHLVARLPDRDSNRRRESSVWGAWRGSTLAGIAIDDDERRAAVIAGPVDYDEEDNRPDGAAAHRAAALRARADTATPVSGA